MKASKARIFKIETMGAVDGPGIRLVFFFQGCPYRCLYCHNPEGWEKISPLVKKMSIRQMLNLYKKNKTFYRNGGITISGGEPLVQIDFLLKFAKICQHKKIHLAISTACGNFAQEKEKYLQLIKYVDLWIIDLKAMNNQDHYLITKQHNLNEIDFINILEKHGKPYWLSYVLVDKLTNQTKQLVSLGKFIAKLKFIKKFILLSYHNMAINKYNNLKINYPLLNTSILSTSQKQKAFEIIRKYRKNDKVWISSPKN